MSAKDQWARQEMNAQTRALVAGLGSETFDVLEISGRSWKGRGFRSYRWVDYPAFDICERSLDESFHLIIAEQVFEHIRHPHRAAGNVLKMLHPGGAFLITTPFVLRYHPCPLDLWRWSAQGMKFFLEDCGFENVRTWSWGNRDCVVANLDTWTAFDPSRHSLANDPKFPIVVWGLGERGR